MSSKLRIAVIGSGISGLVAAYLLQQKYQVTLLEKNKVIGGHTRTLFIEEGDKKIPVDTGFIVFNKENYPTLCALFNALDVPSQDSNMSFGVSLDSGRLEYGTTPLKRIFSQKRNLVSIKHWQMLFGIRRFNKDSLKLLKMDENPSLGEFLSEKKYSEAFIERFIVPMAASIWSSAPKDILNFPAKHLIRFFSNHGLLDAKERKQWRTVTGGSQTYINQMLSQFQGKVKTDVCISKLERSETGVTLSFKEGETEVFDQVVLACHSDQALSLLAESATQEEKSILGDIRFQSNRVILHSDISLMPKRKKAWQSWNFLSESNSWGEPRVCLSYWMNLLQSIQSQEPLIVSLNPDNPPDEILVKDVWDTQHPIFNQAAINAQSRLPQIQGKNKVWFAGAWQGYGFHEDGALSGLRVAEALGCKLKQ